MDGPGAAVSGAVWQAALKLFGLRWRSHARASFFIMDNSIIVHEQDIKMPEPIIKIAAKSEQNDIFMIRWRYEDSYNITIYPSYSISPFALYTRAEHREHWPLENGIVRPPEYFSQVLRTRLEIMDGRFFG